MRDSLRLEVVELPDKAERLAWLATHLPELPGSGIVYTLTKNDAESVASWLSERGIAAAAYSGETDPAVREEIERKLLANEVKAVVATSALGMGYDKPDLGFVVHYQAPGSVIAYYQQVGRAGARDRRCAGRPAARRRRSPDPGLLHHAGLPAAGARAAGPRHHRRGRRLRSGPERAARAGQARTLATPGHAQGARRRRRRREARQPVRDR